MDITEEDKNRIEQDAEAHSNSFQPNENIYGAFDIQQLRLYAKKDYIKGAIHELELLAEEREIAKNAYLAISQREQLKNGIIQELEQKNKEMEEQLDLAIHGGNVFKNQADELKQVLKNFYEGFVSQFPKPPDYENIEKLLKQ